MLTTILFFLLALNAMIFVHELGHLVAAKWSGMPVDRFSIGFGSEIVGVDWGETRYSLAWIPMGGYVNIDTPTGLDQEAPLYKRMITISAGVIMNIVLAFFVFASIPMIWGVSTPPPAQLSYIESSEFPASATGFDQLPRHQTIQSIEGQSTDTWRDVSMTLLSVPGRSATITFEGGQAFQVQLPPGEEGRLQLARSLYPTTPPITGSILEDGPAARAGFESGDRVIEAAGQPIRSWRGFLEVIRSHPGAEISAIVERNGHTRQLTLTPRARPATELPALPGKASGESPETVGWIGMAMDQPQKRLGLVGAMQHGAREIVESAVIIQRSLDAIIGGPMSVRQLAGPIAIADMSDQFRQVGWDRFLWFMGMLSVNLAIINFLPLPALDGGYMLMLIIEGVRGRQVPESVMIRWNQVGFALLSVLMALVIVNDLFRVIG